MKVTYTDVDSKDITSIVYFLFHLWKDKPHSMYGAITIEEAFKATIKIFFANQFTFEEAVKYLEHES